MIFQREKENKKEGERQDWDGGEKETLHNAQSTRVNISCVSGSAGPGRVSWVQTSGPGSLVGRVLGVMRGWGLKSEKSGGLFASLPFPEIRMGSLVFSHSAHVF